MMKCLRWRTGAAFFVALSLLACGQAADEADEEVPLVPELAGDFEITGGFDGIPGISFEGIIRVEQASRASPALDGTAFLELHLGADLVQIVDDFQQAAMAQDSVVTFSIYSRGVTWAFTGQLASGIVTGRHIFSDSTGAATGSFFMTQVELRR